jgi:GST-like protein
MACYPWILKYHFLGLQLDNFPDLKRWADQLTARPAIIRAYEKGTEINSIPTVTRESMRFLFSSEISHLAE